MTDYGTAAAQSMLMLQKVNKMIDLVQNLDSRLAKQFAPVPKDDIGLQNYRQPLQIEVGGIVGMYNPDGGNYFQGTGAEYDQAIVAPVPIMDSISTTELSARISKGGKDVVVDNYLAKLIRDVKQKVAHKYTNYLQTDGTGLLATIDSSYSSGTTIPLLAGEFGGRLLDLGDQLQAFNHTNNALRGISNVTAISKNGIGTLDTITVDNAQSVVAGDTYYPIGVAATTPVFLAGLKYIVTPSTSGSYFNISRAQPYVQAPALNANGAFLTLGGLMIFLQRMEQAVGSERFQSDRAKNFWYLHGANWVSAQMLGFAKQIVTMSDGKAPVYDGLPNVFGERTLGGMPAITESVAAVDKVYWLDKSVLCSVRYPGSEAFIPGMIEGGLFWPRQSSGQWSTESDAFYQDSRNFFSRNPWAGGVYYGLGTQPGFAS